MVFTCRTGMPVRSAAAQVRVQGVPEAVPAVGGQAGFPWQQYPLRTKFSNVQGMKSGAVVRVAGKDVGKVTRVDLVGALHQAAPNAGAALWHHFVVRDNVLLRMVKPGA